MVQFFDRSDTSPDDEPRPEGSASFLMDTPEARGVVPAIKVTLTDLRESAKELLQH